MLNVGYSTVHIDWLNELKEYLITAGRVSSGSFHSVTDDSVK